MSKRRSNDMNIGDDSSDEEVDPKKQKAAENMKQWDAIKAHMQGNSKPLLQANKASAAQKELEKSMGKMGLEKKGGRTRRHHRGKKVKQTHRKKLFRRRK